MQEGAFSCTLAPEPCTLKMSHEDHEAATTKTTKRKSRRARREEMGSGLIKGHDAGDRMHDAGEER
jgi:hypothetical protein